MIRGTRDNLQEVGSKRQWEPGGRGFYLGVDGKPVEDVEKRRDIFSKNLEESSGLKGCCVENRLRQGAGRRWQD